MTNKSSESIPLYKIPKNSKIYAELSDGSAFLYFRHIDGAYSVCEAEKSGYFHLSASTPLVKFEDGFKIFEGE